MRLPYQSELKPIATISATFTTAPRPFQFKGYTKTTLRNPIFRNFQKANGRGPYIRRHMEIISNARLLACIAGTAQCGWLRKMAHAGRASDKGLVPVGACRAVKLSESSPDYVDGKYRLLVGVCVTRVRQRLCVRGFSWGSNVYTHRAR